VSQGVPVPAPTALAGGSTPTPTRASTPSTTVTPAPAPTTPAPSPATDTAGGVLEQAATLASSSAGSAFAATGYLRVATKTEQLVLHPMNSSRTGATAGWVSTGEYVTYVPADRSAEWVRVFEPGATIAGLYGPGAQEGSQQWLTDLAEVIAMRTVNRTVGGLHDDGGGVAFGSDAYFAQMPLDPGELLEWYGGMLVDGNADLSQVFGAITQDLELNAAPPALRASMFRALALSPGVEIESVNGAVTTLRYSHDSGYSPDEVGGGVWTETVSIDTGTGFVTGTSRTMGSGSAVIPDTVPDSRTTTTFSVVGTAP
jgi:hypothetical protein